MKNVLTKYEIFFITILSAPTGGYVSIGMSAVIGIRDGLNMLLLFIGMWALFSTLMHHVFNICAHERIEKVRNGEY